MFLIINYNLSNLLKNYSSRLAEIEEELTFLEAKEAFASEKWNFFRRIN